jgi:hypothetical protein
MASPTRSGLGTCKRSNSLRPILDHRPILKMSALTSVPLGFWMSRLCWIQTSDIKFFSGSCPWTPTKSSVTLIPMNFSLVSSLPCIYPSSPLISVHEFKPPDCIPHSTAHVSHSLGSQTHILVDSPFLPPFVSHLAPQQFPLDFLM